MEITLYSEIKSCETNSLVKEGVRYMDVLTALVNGSDVYEVMGHDADSFDREHVFQRLSELLGCEYDSVYLLWLNGVQK